MRETPLMKSIMLAVGRLPFLKIFRNNTGMAWTGQKTGEFTKEGSRYVVIKDARPLHAGLCVGSSDLIGWKTITVTADMVGKKVAVFTAIEVKAPKGRPTQEQLNFIDKLKDSGGYAGVARSPEEALRIISE